MTASVSRAARDASAAVEAAVPLFDRARLAALWDGLAPATLVGLLREALAEAGQAHGALAGLPDRPGEAGREEAGRAAHKLRGTAGCLGLARVEALAAVIEARAANDGGDGDGGDLVGLVARLGEAVAATRAAVARPGDRDLGAGANRGGPEHPMPLAIARGELPSR